MTPLVNAIAALATAVLVAVSPPSTTSSSSYDSDHPREIGELIGVAERWTPDEVGALAHFFKAEEYWMVETPVLFLSDGMVRMDSKMTPIGEDGYTTVTGEIDEGVWVNVTDAHVFVAGPDGEPFQIAPGYVVAIGDTIPWAEAFQDQIEEAAKNDGLEDRGCRVWCGDGFYACCNGAGCRCRATSKSHQGCSSGGPGATSCELMKEDTSYGI